MNLGHLFIFAHVAETGSFTNAARCLDMPISRVSRQVVELEDQLGLKLILRSTRSLRLTEAGLEILKFARQTIDINNSILDVVSDKAAHVSGKIIMSSPPCLARLLLAPLVQAFQATYPEVNLQVKVSDRTFDPVSDGIDLTFRVGPSKCTSLVGRKIMEFHHRLLASRKYVETRGLPESPIELSKHRILSLSCSGTEESWTLFRADGVEEIVLPIAPALSVNDCDSLVNSLLSGGGIGNLPSMVAAELIREGKVVEVLPRWRFPTADVSIIRSGRRHIGRPAREFIDFAARLAPELMERAAAGFRETSHAAGSVQASASPVLTAVGPHAVRRHNPRRVVAPPLPVSDGGGYPHHPRPIRI